MERRRAVEVALMGSEDPKTSRLSNTNSLREMYGTSLLIEDNAIFGSPNTTTEEHLSLQLTTVSISPILLSERMAPFALYHCISSGALATLNPEHAD
jgi:hypothetical protein